MQGRQKVSTTWSKLLLCGHACAKPVLCPFIKPSTASVPGSLTHWQLATCARNAADTAIPHKNTAAAAAAHLVEHGPEGLAAGQQSDAVRVEGPALNQETYVCQGLAVDVLFTLHSASKQQQHSQLRKRLDSSC
jgi:hypothetical protein